MKLYHADYRMGNAVITVRKPEWITEEVPEEVEMRENFASMFYAPGRVGPDGRIMSYAVQLWWWNHFVKMGLYGYGLTGAELKAWVLFRMDILVAPTPLLTYAAGYAILFGLIYAGLYLLDVTRTEFISEHDYGTGWLMRYENRVWWAEYAGFYDRGSPIFRKLDEIGVIIAYEYRKRMGAFGFGDTWIMAGAAFELKRTFPFWTQSFWDQSYNKYHGLLYHVNQDFYAIKPQYYEWLPPDWQL